MRKGQSAKSMSVLPFLVESSDYNMCNQTNSRFAAPLDTNLFIKRYEGCGDSCIGRKSTRSVISIHCLMNITYFLSAEIDSLKKFQTAKPIGYKLNEIPQPTKIISLQDAMGLTDNRKLYIFLPSTIFPHPLYSFC